MKLTPDIDMYSIVGVYIFFFLIVWVVHAVMCEQSKKLEPVCAEVIAFLCLGYWGGGRGAGKNINYFIGK